MRSYRPIGFQCSLSTQKQKFNMWSQQMKSIGWTIDWALVKRKRHSSRSSRTATTNRTSVRRASANTESTKV